MDSQQNVTKKNTVDVFNVNQWLPGNFHRNKSDVIGFDKSQIINSSKKISRHQLLRSGNQKLERISGNAWVSFYLVVYFFVMAAF